MSRTMPSVYLLQLEIGHKMPGSPSLNLDLMVEGYNGHITGSGTFWNGTAAEPIDIAGISGFRRASGLGKSRWLIELTSEANNGFRASMDLDSNYDGLCTYGLAGQKTFYNQPVSSGVEASNAASNGAGGEGIILGGWTTYSPKIDDKARKVFESATENIFGVDYEPLAVATQLVAGTNYGFFCNAKVVRPNSFNQAAMVYIHQPLPGQGDPVVVNIEKVPGFRYGN